ncbi:MAG TPA: cytochrome ubiquinol oxidase subunit I, partial [Steroidobacteraceae bacterium]
IISSGGASILAIGYLLPIVYLVWSLRYGERAGNNPWNARGLEWQTSSPPPKENFLRPPVVREAYSYHEPAP